MISAAFVKPVKNIIPQLSLTMQTLFRWIVRLIASLTIEDCEFYCLPISFRVQPFFTNLLACHQTSCWWCQSTFLVRGKKHSGICACSPSHKAKYSCKKLIDFFYFFEGGMTGH